MGQLIGTLRYTTAGCYYGYFAAVRDYSDNSVSSANVKQVKISLYGNGVFSIYVSLQKWIRSTLFYFHMAKASSVTMISVLLLCRSYISQNLDLPLSCF